MTVIIVMVNIIAVLFRIIIIIIIYWIIIDITIIVIDIDIIFYIIIIILIAGKVFKAAIRKRLLHTGASTTQILEMYVSMIRALRVLDSSDLVLNFIAAPVRTYLTGRKDTVRCIVSSFTKNKNSDLHGKMRNVF